MSAKKIKREHFAFLRSYWEQIKLLPSKKQKSEVFEAILSVQFFEKEINSISFSNQNQMILWEGLKPILKQSQKGYLDKMGLQGQNPMQGATQDPMPHKDKDKDKEIEREGESATTTNIFYSLSNNIKIKEMDNYIEYLISGDEFIPRPSGFKRKIEKQFEKEDKFQLRDFEKWYLAKECDIYKSKYVGKYIYDIQIEDIYPFTSTKGNNKEYKFIISYADKDVNPSVFSDKYEIENVLSEACNEII